MVAPIGLDYSPGEETVEGFLEPVVGISRYYVELVEGREVFNLGAFCLFSPMVEAASI